MQTMTQDERQAAYNIINSILPFLTDDELKALTVLAVTRETSTDKSITNI